MSEKCFCQIPLEPGYRSRDLWGWVVVSVASTSADFSGPPTRRYYGFIHCQQDVKALNLFYPVLSVMLFVLALIFNKDQVALVRVKRFLMPIC